VAARVLTDDDLEPLRREIAELRALVAARAVGDVLSTKQAAQLAGVTAKTVRAWIDAGKLPAGHRGARRTIQRADLERYLAGERPAGASPEGMLRRLG
jgi:excisionase family DNA binding protein